MILNCRANNMTKFLHELTKRGTVWMSSWTKHLEWWRSVALCQVERFFRYIQLFHSSSLFTGTHEPNKVTCSQLSCFLAQLAEHCNRGHGSESRCSHPDFSGVYKKQLLKVPLPPQVFFFFWRGVGRIFISLKKSFSEYFFKNIET